jgi:hypothetical protein
MSKSIVHIPRASCGVGWRETNAFPRQVERRSTGPNTPGGSGVNYPSLVPMTREIDLATVLFERAVSMVTAQASG